MKKAYIYFIIFASCAFLMIACYVLLTGSLHEDAYILFNYSRRLAAGQGIVFDSVHGHAEGATDFLWMLSLAAMTRIFHIPLGICAAILNAIGLCGILLSLWKIRGKADGKLFALGLLATISGGTAASLGGFSPLAYGGLFLAVIFTAIEGQTVWFFSLGLLLCLFRPDGVLLFSGTFLYLITHNRCHEGKHFFKYFLYTALLGMIYFVWRYFYFGFLLPLPLLVKSKTDSILEGVTTNISALKWYIPLFTITTIVFFKAQRSVRDKSKLALLGAGFLFIALSFAHQSQNVGYRFQFPILMAILTTSAICLPNKSTKPMKLALLISFILPVINGTRLLHRDLTYLTNDDYINTFPQILNKRYPGIQTLAVTEAGRLPYWYDAPSVLDIIGLNSPEIVRRGPSLALQTQHPDLIFVNHANTYIFPYASMRNSFFTIKPSEIQTTTNTSKNPIITAPKEALEFAKQNNYTAVAVKYGNNDPNYTHVYFLSNRIFLDKFTQCISESQNARESYSASIHADKK